MSIIKRAQRQMLVYWPKLGAKPTGESIWGAPIEMTCRWDKGFKQIIGPNITKVDSQIQVISQYELVVGGLIRLGTLADTAFWDDPKRNQDVYEILVCLATPNIRNTETLYEAYA